MELVITIVLIASIVTNFVTFRSFKKLQSHPVELSPVIESIGCDCKVGLVEEFKEVLLPLLEEKADKIPSPKAPDESYMAWRNQKEEPKTAPPSPHGPAPIPGPLERPYGFSR